MKVAIVRTLKQYCRTSTLHGLKYLYSKYYMDRIIWITWCCATAGCAGVLCAVLWTRFLQMPALLTLREPEGTIFPSIFICPTPERIAYLFNENLSFHAEDSRFVPLLFGLLFKQKAPPLEFLEQLENLLVKNNLTLRGGLKKSMPACDQVLKRCRWQNFEFDCNKLFKREMTEWGMCCAFRPLSTSKNVRTQVQNELEMNQKLNLVLDCYDETMPLACEVFWAFSGEPYHQPTALSRGQEYVGQIKFTSIIDRDHNKLVDGSCDDSEQYSKVLCLDMCSEIKCGCASPFRYNFYDKSNLPHCSAIQLHCILQFDHYNNSCNCANPCESIRSEIAFARNLISTIEYTYDPLYSNLNTTRAIVLTIIVKATASRLLYSMPTETWITLMSSLGGVFNMFLGVGFFSALEVLFYLIIKLPLTIRRYAEIRPVT